MEASSGTSGPPGQPRGVLFGVVVFAVTPGVYGLWWAYKTHEEMRRHTGDGLGGVLGLVVWILVSPISAFVVPSEVGRMYRGAGREPPLTGWTGLWLFPFGVIVIPAIVWFVKVQGTLNRYWGSGPRGAGAPA